MRLLHVVIHAIEAQIKLAPMLAEVRSERSVMVDARTADAIEHEWIAASPIAKRGTAMRIDQWRRQNLGRQFVEQFGIATVIGLPDSQGDINREQPQLGKGFEVEELSGVVPIRQCIVIREVGFQFRAGFAVQLRENGSIPIPFAREQLSERLALLVNAGELRKE